MAKQSRAWLLEPLGLPQCAVAEHEIMQYLNSAPAYPIPFGMRHCGAAINWQDQLVPVMNLSALQAEQVQARGMAVLACQEAPGEALRYLALALQNAPRRITVDDASACDLPAEHGDIWQILANACFLHDHKPTPIVDIKRLCSEQFRDFAADRLATMPVPEKATAPALDMKAHAKAANGIESPVSASTLDGATRLAGVESSAVTAELKSSHGANYGAMANEDESDADSTWLGTGDEALLDDDDDLGWLETDDEASLDDDLDDETDESDDSEDALLDDDDDLGWLETDDEASLDDDLDDETDESDDSEDALLDDDDDLGWLETDDEALLDNDLDDEADDPDVEDNDDTSWLATDDDALLDEDLDTESDDADAADDDDTSWLATDDDLDDDTDESDETLLDGEDDLSWLETDDEALLEDELELEEA